MQQKMPTLPSNAKPNIRVYPVRYFRTWEVGFVDNFLSNGVYLCHSALIPGDKMRNPKGKCANPGIEQLKGVQV